MEALDMATFADYMERLIDRLDRHEQMLHTLHGRIRTKFGEMPFDDNMLDNQDVCLMLKVSKRSLQRYRSMGILPYRLFKRTPYYRRKDVEMFVKEYVKEISKERNGTRKPRIYVQLK